MVRGYGAMFRRVIQVVVTLCVIAAGGVLASRVAEPSVRPVLYPAPPTTVAPPTTTTTVSPFTTVAVTPATTVADVAPVATTVPGAPVTTTAPPPVTTTTVPIDEEAVLTAHYVWGKSTAARTLQTVLGVTVDGWYGPATRAAHLAENTARGFGTGGVPSVPTTTTAPPTTAPPAGEATTSTAPSVTVPSTFGGMGAEIVAQLLGQPCIADGDLGDCPPEIDALISGLVG